MAILEGTWIYIESETAKSHIGMVTAVRKDGYTYIPLTNDDILDADRITLCPVYDYYGSLVIDGYGTSYTRKFKIVSLCNSLYDVTMHVKNGNIVFFSDLPAEFVSAAADAMYAAIDAAETSGSNVIIAEL